MSAMPKRHEHLTLKIDFPPETERRLKSEAARLGVDEAEYAKRVIERSLPPTAVAADQATLDLLARWDREDQTADPAEIARRNREFEELKASMNRNRVESGGADARKVFP
jgi:hypothetical protein